MKAKRMILIWMLLLLCLSAAGCSRRVTQYRSYSGSVSVSLGLGKESLLAESIPFPVAVHIEGEYAAGGRWCVLTVPTNEDDFYSYREELTEEESQDIQYVVPVSAGSSQLVVELLDEGENVIYSRTCTYQAGQCWQSMILCGRLGTQTDTIAWPSVVTYEEQELTVRSVTLTAQNLYTREAAYQLLDFLIADTDSFRELEQAVQQAILAWTEGGGCLVLEGEGGEKLAQELGFSSEPAKSYESISSVALSYVRYGAGSVWTVDEELSQSVPRLSDYQKSRLLLALAGGRSGLFCEDTESAASCLEANFTDVIAEHKTSSLTPEVGVYTVLLVGYLLLGIPGVYLYAHRRKRVWWFRPGVCVLAVVFSLLIFAVGSETRYSAPFIKSVTLIKGNSEITEECIYAGVQAPFNTGYEVSILPDYEVRAVMDQAEWSNIFNVSYRRHTAELTAAKDQTLLALGNLTAFSPRYFMLRKRMESVGEICFEPGSGDGRKQGAVTNGTGFELHSAVIFWGGQVYLAEDWGPGETLDLAQLLQDGSVQQLSREQFLSGGYQNRGGWQGKLADYYLYILDSADSGENLVMAQIDYEPLFQAYTDYSVENETVLLYLLD